MWTICGLKRSIEFYDRFQFKSELLGFLTENQDVLDDIIIFPPKADEMAYFDIDDFLNEHNK